MSDIMTTFFGGVWDLFSNFTVPGFGISLAKVAIGFFVIRFSLSLLSVVTGFRSNIGYDAYQFRVSSESASHYKNVYDHKSNVSTTGGLSSHV